ncbi:MAG: DUF1854 domain-containing protein [Pirellulaceae bacterium]|nr:DUF1854 domain-containing protein [Pirellulaceae bacterium]
MSTLPSNIDPRQLELSRDEWGKLCLELPDGTAFAGVMPIRLFPFSQPDRWISLCDQKQHEIVLLDNLIDLPDPAQKLIEQELAQREFIPIITRVLRVSGLQEPCEWDVETDRGPTTFILGSEDDIRRLGDDRALIIDAERIRYLVGSLGALDPRSRRFLEWYI